MNILAIETSCDETAMALVEASGRLPAGRQGLRAPKFKILKEAVASQVKIHRPFGGVVPSLAKREHQKNLPILLKKLLYSRFQILDSVDMIAVTVGPGLEPALWQGIVFAQELAKKHKKPLIGVSHLEGHLYSFLLPKTLLAKPYTLNPANIFPAIALIVSGGHTVLLLVKNLRTWEKLGETRDDAVGEAFDKVARMLGLPYPGGPALEKLAATLSSSKGGTIPFPRPMLNDKSFDFSFSGLKTAVLYHLRGQNSQTNADDTRNYAEKSPRESASSQRKSALAADVAASFQKAAIDVLVKKTVRAAETNRAKSILLSGGVAANKLLRESLRKAARKVNTKFLVADAKYNTDNAAMIAAAGYINYLRGKKHPLRANGALEI